MRIIARSALRAFWEKHKDAEIPLKTWYKIVEKADWSNSQDVKKIYANASIVNSNKVVFNIKGDNYRIVVYIVYKFKNVFIRFVGTHQQYDKIDVKNI